MSAYSEPLEQGLQVLVTVHAPMRPARSYLFDDTGRHVGIDANYYLDSQHIDLRSPWLVTQKPHLLGRLAVGLVVVIGLLIGGLGLSHAVTLRVVLTGSMAPTIKPGDVVIAVDDRFRQPHVGDVAVYQGKRFDGSPVAPFAHRIIGGDAVSGWIMRGDANPATDVQRPTSVDILGVVIWTLPRIGYLLSPQLLLALALAIFAIWLIADGVGGGP